MFIYDFLDIFVATTVSAKGVTANKITIDAFQTGGFFLHANSWSDLNSCLVSGAVVF